MRRSASLHILLALLIAGCTLNAAAASAGGPSATGFLGAVTTPAPPTPTATPRPSSGIAGPGPTSLGQAVLHHTLIATDINALTGELINEGDAFPAGTDQIIFAMGWNYAAPGTELRLRLFQRGMLVYEDAHVVVNSRADGTDLGFVFGVVAEGGFPSDRYQVEVAYNGVPDELLEFTVGQSLASGVVIGTGSGAGPIPYKDPGEVLVITRASVLRERLGADADAVLAAAGAVGELHDLDEGGVERDTPEAAAAFVHQLLRTGGFRYLLIVGNDDAVPFFRVDNPMASSEIGILADYGLPAEWQPSDDPYTDLDGDPYGTPDIATARIPSSDDAQLLLTQLGENVPPDGHGYALLNYKRRSQGGAVVAAMNTGTAVQVDYAPPRSAEEFNAGPAADARYTYILLHGIATETTEWSADVAAWYPVDPTNPFGNEWLVAPFGHSTGVTLAGNPGSRGLVSVGACYGGWTLDVDVPEGVDPSHATKTAENNLALFYLKSGTRALVADTHISYSFPLDLDAPAIGRTGFEMYYWRAVQQGMAPIDAFLLAKQESAAAIDLLVAEGLPNVANITLKTLHHMVYFGRP